MKKHVKKVEQMNLIELRKHKDEVISLYEQGLTAYRIGKIFNTHDMNVGVILRENNVQLRDKRDNRRYKFDEHYMDKIDTPEKAYILGLFYADGCNDKKYNRITLTLQKEDTYLLDEIRKLFKSDKKLYFTDNSKKENIKDAKMLALVSEHLCQVLNDYGMVPEKSLILEWPIWLREDLYSHFIRGYFDGDGSITSNIKRKDVGIEITSSFIFCEGLHNFLKDIGIKSVLTPEENPLSGDVCIYNYSNGNALRFLEFVYKDASIFMQRKFNRAMGYFFEK